MDTALLFSEFMRALRSSCVKDLSFRELVFTPELATLLLQTPIVAASLGLSESGSCTELTTNKFREVLLHFSATDVHVSECDLRACQITEEFLRTLSKKGVLRTSFTHMWPVDGGSFHVTDDAIVNFCLEEDVQIDRQEEDAAPKRRPHAELHVDNGIFTKNLFKRLIEASSASTRTKPLRITVSPLLFEDEDLRDYAQHLSYRRRGTPFQSRIYDLPSKQHGATTAMHLQIVLSLGDSKIFRHGLSSCTQLTMIRARRPNDCFYESDE